MNHSQEMRANQGESWLSLFFWPAFRRLFLPGSRREVAQERTPRRSRQAALKSKRPAQKVLEATVPQEMIDAQLESWIRWTLESNIALAAALKRIRNSYILIQAGKPAKDADQILAQVEDALQNAEKMKQ
jgi:hypothetical protein